MYKTFGKTKSWKRILLPSILLIGLFSLPMTALFISTLLVRMNFEHFLVTTLLVIFVFYFPVKHLCNLYAFPFIEIDDNFMVLTQSFQSRNVYTLNQITSVKPIMKSIFFMHNGFPVLINIHALTERERKHFLEIIEVSTSNRASQNHNANTVC